MALVGLAAVAVVLAGLAPRLGWHIGHLGATSAGSGGQSTGSGSGGGGGSGGIVTRGSTSTGASPGAAPASATTSRDLRARTLAKFGSVASVAVGDDLAFASDDRHNQVVSFDPATGRIVRTVPMAGPPASAVFAGGALWVAEPTVNELVELDPHSLFVMRIVAMPVGPTDMAVLGNMLWVTSTDHREVTPVTLDSGAVGTPLGVLAGAVDVQSGFGVLWVTGLTDLVTTISPVFVGAPAERVVAVGQGPLSVAVGTQSIWVADAEGATVSQVDPASLRVSATFAAGVDPRFVAVSGDGRVFVASGSGQNVTAVAPAPGSDVLHIASQPSQLVPAASGVWVAGSGPGVVAVS